MWLRLAAVCLCVLFHLSLSCDKTEYRCNNGRCIRSNLYCDGTDHCGDKSDESPHCTLCNRTYYGDEGRSYGLELRPPRQDALPHVCQLTFTADGGERGDILQLAFHTFSVGRFTSHVVNGCPDGYMQISEAGRPVSGGMWCGNGWGYNVYYSEHSTAHVVFKLFRLAGGNGFGGEEASQFYVKLQYKFISLQRAVMRIGRKSSKFRGITVHNSFCDYMFDNCDRDLCRIQSPNFPGLYPRNVTCSYHVTHSTPPRGQRALLVISQPQDELINIKDSDSANGEGRRLQTGSKCDLVRDHVTVYDGVTKSAPKLLKFCGGGRLPEIVSSGPNLIVEFRSSAYDRFSQPAFSLDKLKHPTSYIPGFEINIAVRFVNISDRTQYVENHDCNYVFSSTVQTHGYIYSPRHSLPPNTTCTYSLLGRSHERLWMYFIAYHVDYHSSHEVFYAHDAKSRHCHHRLDLIDGAPGGLSNQSLGFFCGDSKPRLCSRAWRALHGAAVTSCASDESYLSSTENATLVQQHTPGLGLDAARFMLRYEFVDMREDGQQYGGQPCHRVFNSRGRLSKGTFGPAKNVFLYGRGGKRNLRCVFRFQGAEFEQVRVVVNKYTSEDVRGCETVFDKRLKRYQCRYHGQVRSELRVAEITWPRVRVWRDCICAGQTGGAALVIESTANVLELQYDVYNMTAAEDYHSYSFIAMYEFLRRSSCIADNKINGSSGTLQLGRQSPEQLGTLGCETLPWLLTSSAGAHLFLSVQGRRDAPGECPGQSRLLVSAAEMFQPLAVVCPGVAETVEVFSAGWSNPYPRLNQTRQYDYLVLQLINPHPGQTVHISWLELTRPQIVRSEVGSVKPFSAFGQPAARQAPCLHMCPELAGACIDPSLWCDDHIHCPSGRDEDPGICHRWNVPWLYIGVGCAAVLIIIILSIAALTRRRSGDRARPDPTVGVTKQLPTNETLATGTVYSSFSSMKNGKDLTAARSTLSMDSENLDLVETTV